MGRPPEVIEKIKATKAAQTHAIANSVARGGCGTSGCRDASCSTTYGLCHCGCGEPAPRSRQSDRRRGYVKGEPVLFLPGHNGRAGTLRARDRGEPLAAAIQRSGCTERELSLRAGLAEGVVSELVDRIGYGLGRDRCERLVTVINDALREQAAATVSVDELFTQDVPPARERGKRARPALDRRDRYDGRHFKTQAMRATAAHTARARGAAAAAELDRLKAADDLLELAEAAAQLVVHPAYVQQLAARGRLTVRRVKVTGSPRTRVLVPAGEVVALRQRWARVGAESHGRLLLDPDEAVARWRAMGWLENLVVPGRITEADAEAIVRARVAERRRRILVHRRGRKPRTSIPAHHLEWLDAFRAVRADHLAEHHEREQLDLLAPGERPPSEWYAYEAVADHDFTEHPARWPSEYASTSDPGSLDRRVVRTAAQRVYKAVKPLLDAQTEITAA